MIRGTTCANIYIYVDIFPLLSQYLSELVNIIITCFNNVTFAIYLLSYNVL